MKIHARYIQGDFTIKFSTYAADDSTAIEFVHPDGRPGVKATVMVRDSNLGRDEVLIKSWSENEGLADELMRVGLIGPIKRYVPTGHVEATVHDLFVSKPARQAASDAYAKDVKRFRELEGIFEHATPTDTERTKMAGLTGKYAKSVGETK